MNDKSVINYDGRVGINDYLVLNNSECTQPICYACCDKNPDEFYKTYTKNINELHKKYNIDNALAWGDFIATKTKNFAPYTRQLLVFPNGFIRDPEVYHAMIRTPTPQKQESSTSFTSIMMWIIIFLILAYAYTQSSIGGGGSSQVTSTEYTSSSIGYLFVAADSGANLYVGNSYQGRGSFSIPVAPGTYTVSAYGSSTNKLCWSKQTTVYSGKTSIIRDDTWCR